jgi:hypothetical protein
MKRLIAPILLVAALAACGKSENKSAEAVPAAAPVPAVVQGPAPGKWRMTTSMNGQAMPSMEICIDKQMTFEDSQQMQKEAGITCSEQSYRRDLTGKIIGHSVCQSDSMKMTTDMVVTGDMNTAYVMENTTTMEPAPAPNMGTMKMSAKAERIGDCTPAK